MAGTRVGHHHVSGGFVNHGDCAHLYHGRRAVSGGIWTVFPHGMTAWRFGANPKERRPAVRCKGFFENLFSAGNNSDNTFDTGKFVPLDSSESRSLDGSSDETFGPLALLAVGLVKKEFLLLQQLMLEMGADEVTLIPYTSKMVGKSLGEALDIEIVPEHEEPCNQGTPVVFLSGMYSSEVVEVVTALRCSPELPDMAFAAAVPNNWNRRVNELIDDVSSDHAAVRAMKEGRGLNDA